MLANLIDLKNTLEGDLYTDKKQRLLYATDASVYREIPLAIAIPKSESDLKKLITFANQHKVSLIPRTAGTSLAGQVVGNGIVVDVSKHFTNIIEINQEEKWVRLQPGIVRDDLNKILKPYGLFFSPETSTANRCMVGGMVGNNSCGTHSPLYGTTRDHTLELKTILADGSDVVFKSLTKEEFVEKTELDSLEGAIYRFTNDTLKDPNNQDEIRKEFPDTRINRRNTGYAIDVLLESDPFTDGKEDFNFCKLLAGSEGTLAFTTEIKLNLTPLPPKENAVIAMHFDSVKDSLKANIIALKYNPGASELMDKIILDCTKNNINQSKNRFFVKGDPAAVLCVEFERDTKEEIESLVEQLIQEVKAANLGYHYPVVWGKDVTRVWNLRKAGLGLLANIPGDEKAVACIEDTAVTTDDLPDFIEEFDEIMRSHGKESIYYAHAGDGEIHLRPILDLKKSDDRQLFFDITNDVATLVKKYNGSLSGEHGDGRVRAPFIKKMIGGQNYELIKEVKKAWDPNNIFNPGKIVDAPPMNEFLRYEADVKDPEIETHFDFSESQGILKMAEKCNGTGLCRRNAVSGGTMCPSYMASQNEHDTTRGRANILREFLTHSPKKNRFDHQEIKEVMEMCLGCKGCKSDCPSNVDVAKMKSEFLQQYYESNGVPAFAKQVALSPKISEKFEKMPWLFNLGNSLPGIKSLVKNITGIHPKRNIPLMANESLRTWYKKAKQNLKPTNPKKKIYFFADEVINYTDVSIGIKGIELLSSLGYEVEIPKHTESGRPSMSKGLLKMAKATVEENIKALKGLITSESPLIGIEPSAILGFRDEYISLTRGQMQKEAKTLSENCFLIDEFIAQEIKNGNITSEQFTKANKKIKLHGHCHQKALSDQTITQQILSLPENFEVDIIPSGCCGMSGSFGYEKDKYELSMQIGELVLFPAIRNAAPNTVIAATGTSCRHQIKDGTATTALHPVEILWDALA